MLIPDAEGNLGRVLFGLGGADAAERGPLLLGKLATALPKGRLPPRGRRRRAGAGGACLRARKLPLRPLPQAEGERRTACRAAGRGRDRDRPDRRRNLSRSRSDQHAGERSFAARSRACRNRACRPLRRGRLDRRGRRAGARLPADPRGRRGERPPALPDRHPLGSGERSEGHADRQGHRLRHGRARHQAGDRHGADEEGHGRRRERARPGVDGDGGEAEGASAGSCPGSGERHFGTRLPAGRRLEKPQGPDGRDRQHRRRRPSRACRCACACRRGGPESRRHHGDLDRSRARSARPGAAGLFHRRRLFRVGARIFGGRGLRSGLAAAALEALRFLARLEGGRRQPHRAEQLRRRDRRCAFPASFRVRQHRPSRISISSRGTRRRGRPAPRAARRRRSARSSTISPAAMPEFRLPPRRKRRSNRFGSETKPEAGEWRCRCARRRR